MNEYKICHFPPFFLLLSPFEIPHFDILHGSFCLLTGSEEEFFIQKAIGWALREYAKTEPGKVGDFVKGNQDNLSKLSIREATKHIGMR